MKKGFERERSFESKTAHQSMMQGKAVPNLLQDEVANTSSERNNHGVNLDTCGSTLELSRLAGSWCTNSGSRSGRQNNTGSSVTSVVAGDDGRVGGRDGAGAVGGGVTSRGGRAGHGDGVDAVDG